MRTQPQKGYSIKAWNPPRIWVSPEQIALARISASRHFSVAYDKGKAEDSIQYFVANENQDLGVVKALRKPVSKLDLSPFYAPS
ncbi:MAG: hypothetical protein RMZ69_19440 [Nostoc sp. ChiQUE01a]|nr:hypothetical protein [Nostoc sp. ChiQUE01a]